MNKFLLSLFFISSLSLADTHTNYGNGAATTWPTSGDVVVSNGTNSPAGVAEVDGDCLVGSAGAWTAGSCSGSTSITVGTTTISGGTTGAIEYNNGGTLGEKATGTGSGQVVLGGTITAGGPTGSTTVTPVITYNAAGQLTTVTTATIAPAVGSVTGLGTGIATALGVNVGTAGAPVINGGALGTPSSGTITSLTGTCTSCSIGGNAATATSATTVVTNANLTGDVTSSGNATTVVKLNGTALSGLATGILKNTTSTGVPSIAVAADFPTLNQNTTGSAGTVTTINGLIAAGTNITLSGSGTSGSPYSIAASGGGSANLYVGSSSGSPTTPTVGAYQGQVAIGDNAVVGSSGAGNFAIGTNAGDGVGHTGAYNYAIGYDSSVFSNGNGSFSIGSNAAVNSAGAANYSVGAATSNTSSGTGNMIFGYTGVIAGTANNGIALGNCYTSGTDAICGAGADHSGTYGAQGNNSVSFGKLNVASAAYTTTSGGVGNVASATASGVGSGNANTASGAYSFVGGGYGNQAAGTYSTIPGGNSGKTSYYGQLAYASGNLATFGDAQISTYVLRGTTTNAVATTIYLDGNSAKIGIQTTQAVGYTVTVVAHDTTTVANNAVWTTLTPGIVFNNGGTLANTAPTFNAAVVTAGVWTGATPSVSVSGTNLVVQVAGPTSTTDTIHWVVTIKTVEVTN